MLIWTACPYRSKASTHRTLDSPSRRGAPPFCPEPRRAAFKGAGLDSTSSQPLHHAVVASIFNQGGSPGLQSGSALSSAAKHRPAIQTSVILRLSDEDSRRISTAPVTEEKKGASDFVGSQHCCARASQEPFLAVGRQHRDRPESCGLLRLDHDWSNGPSIDLLSEEVWRDLVWPEQAFESASSSRPRF